MTRCLLLSLALVPSVSLAGSPTWFASGAKSVDVPGTFEVPLLRGEETGGRPAVAVVIPGDGFDTPALALLDLTDHTRIPEALAKAAGAKPKGGRATIPVIRIGEVVLTDVRAEVGGDELVLGLTTLPGVAVALLASEGLVRFADAASADALLAQAGEPVQASRESDKPVFIHGQKSPGSGVALFVPASAGGREGSIALSPARELSSVSALPEGATPRAVAGLRYVRGAGTLAGAPLADGWWQVHTGLVDPETVLGVVGNDRLYAFDVAVHGESDRVALSVVKTPKWTDASPSALDIARSTFDEGWRRPSGKKDEVATEPPSEGAAAVGRLSAYADALWLSGDAQGALTHYALAADAAGETCSAYLELGRHRLLAGDAKGALEPLEQAGTLWERWERQDVELKQELADEKKKEKAVEKNPEAFAEAQPSACHEAWGLLAGAHLALGNTDEIAKLYAEHVDLDPMLPHVYGLALLRGGEADAANGPLRRAVNLGARNDPQTRLALGYANAKAGRAEVLERQHDRLATAALTPSLTDAVVALELERLANGMASADALAARLVETDPDSVAARLGQAWAWHRTGDSAKAAAAVPAIQALLAAEAARHPGTVRVGAWQAVAAALSGDAAKAKTALDAAAKAGAPDPDHAVAAFLVASIGGDAKAALESLAALQTRHPWVTVPMEWKQAF